VLISVVLSFRNEAENILELNARLEAVFTSQQIDYEILWVNDASTDASLEILRREHARNARVAVINLSRRFGIFGAIRAGMAASSGDAVIFMDSDLQDPPQVIPQLIERWKAGADVVHTVRTRRFGENPLKMALTRLAYWLIHFGSSIALPVDAGDFKLLSRRAMTHLLACEESDPYLRGLTVWIGFNQAYVQYERNARHAGRTHFPFFSRNPWKTFAIGLTSFSFMPIYLCIALAAIGLIVSFVLLAFGLFLYAAATFFWATTVGAVAIVGFYIIRIYKDVRRRPQYIVESTIQTPAERETAAREIS
jgi:dolichol-phosphate mannosyltransferase